MSNLFSRSNLLRAAVLALGTAAALPALAQTDMIPLDGRDRAASQAWSGTYATPAYRGPVVTTEPGSIGNVEGTYRAFSGRTPLANNGAAGNATDAYGAAIGFGAN